MKNNFLFLAFCVFIFASCGSDEHAGHNHSSQEHAHSLEPIQKTAYSNNYEVFIELTPFIVGDESSILSHFTHLQNFKPLLNGKVTARLVCGNKTISTKEMLIKNGIYKFYITPEIAGNASLFYDINNNGEIETIEIKNITIFSDDEAAEHAPHQEFDDGVVFTKKQSWKINFATEKPKVEAFGNIIKSTGQVLSAQADEIIISAKTSGIVKFSTKALLEGTQVSQGTTLFSISGDGMVENNEAVKFAEAKNALTQADANYTRTQNLAIDKIVSEKELLKAETEYKNAKIVFDNINKSYSTKGQKGISSMTGFIKQLFVKNGEFVEAGQAIMSVSKNKSLIIRTELQQKYAHSLANVYSATIKTMTDEKVYSLEELNGKVLSYGRNTNNDNFLIPISLQIDNKGSFISGGFVEVYLKSKTNSQAITIPSSALIEEQSNFFVFVQITPELFEKREVTLGATDGIRTEIVNGIHKDERIVTKGAVLIKLAQSSGALDPHAGHVH